MKGFLGAFVHGSHVVLARHILEDVAVELTAESGNLHRQVYFHANLASTPVRSTGLLFAYCPARVGQPH